MSLFKVLPNQKLEKVDRKGFANEERLHQLMEKNLSYIMGIRLGSSFLYDLLNRVFFRFNVSGERFRFGRPIHRRILPNLVFHDRLERFLVCIT